MAEWLKAHAWKACIPQGIQGSNPCLSAITIPRTSEEILKIVINPADAGFIFFCRPIIFCWSQLCVRVPCGYVDFQGAGTFGNWGLSTMALTDLAIKRAKIKPSLTGRNMHL
jgi:hypothetical protein